MATGDGVNTYGLAKTGGGGTEYMGIGGGTVGGESIGGEEAVTGGLATTGTL